MVQMKERIVFEEVMRREFTQVVVWEGVFFR